MGDKKQIFADVKSLLEEKLGCILIVSCIYETEPWGFQSEDMFWNQALVIETDEEPARVLEVIHQIEKKLGRKRTEIHYASRLIDIDILFYNDLIMNTGELEIPHPRIAERRFVLETLAEIAPDLEHPIYKKTVKELLLNCKDTLGVTKLTVNKPGQI